MTQWMALTGYHADLTADRAGELRRPHRQARLKWVAFIGQLWSLTSLTPGGRNRIQF